MKILVNGGAGYVGSVMVRRFLAEGISVRVLDRLLFGGESLMDLLSDPGFEFVKGDVRDDSVMKEAMQGIDCVVHLSAIVGDPACAKDEDLARSTNLDGPKIAFVRAREAGVRRFVFASTCSNYGRMADPLSYVDEDGDLRPVSLYAETKVESEKFLLSESDGNSCRPVCLRFATAYGMSPRMRFDLTVNEFAKEFGIGREFEVYGQQFWRPYAHVVDIARAVDLVVRSGPEVDGQVLNVGATSENYQKGMIIEEIRRQLPEARVRFVHKDEDPRDYRVSFEKIHSLLGYTTTMKVADGIRHVIFAVRNGLISDPDSDRYRNS